MCLFLFRLVLHGTLLFLDVGNCFLSKVREVFSYCIFKYFLVPSLFSFWDPHNVTISARSVVPEAS